MDAKIKTEIEAAAFRKLVAHLQKRNDVQNIDLMILAGFCRNCLSNWFADEAQKRDVQIDKKQAREIIYGMAYEQWRDQYQTEATPQQLAAMEQASKKH